MKCIECACCNKEEMKCYPKSQDCGKEYDLTEEDLYTEQKCDFARKKGEPIMNYYELCYFHGRKDTGSIYVKTEINLVDFIDEDEFLAELVKRNELDLMEVDTITNIYELTEQEYKDMTL